MKELEIKIAKDLLKIKAVFLRPEEPFTWASGIKSPIYCDNRLTLTAPEVRNDEICNRRFNKRRWNKTNTYSSNTININK